MIPNKIDRGVAISGVAASASFGISRADEGHLMLVLRDTLYSDKVLAVLREYSSNAWDAHRVVGKRDLPIHVTMPTRSEPTLIIRDFGPGLSHNDVFAVYTQYGASTKRDDASAVGMLGLGSKSGFAYSDSFTVTSYFDGVKRVYVAVLDESDRGVINLVHEEPSDEVGVEIRMAIRNEDIIEFQSKGRKLFQHFEPRPIINIDLPDLPAGQTRLTNGIITPASEHRGEWIAVMGCVPYRVNLDQLPVELIGQFLPNIAGVLYFEIGDVQVSASREELKYSTSTKAALVTKINALVDEFVVYTLAQLEAGGFTAWEKRLRSQVLREMELPVSDLWAALAEEHVKLIYVPEDFTLVHNRSVGTRVKVTASARLLIDDTGKDLVGYNLNYSDYVVRPAAASLAGATNLQPSPAKTVAETQAKLDECLLASHMTGIPIVLLSTLIWNEPYRANAKPKRKANPKHRVQTFRLVGWSGTAPYSEHWAPELRVPDPKDVYVVITDFKAVDYTSFFRDYSRDRAMSDAFGVAMPEVYGYKTTPKKPIDVSKLVGSDYAKWRLTFAQTFLTPDRIGDINKLYWASTSELGNYNYNNYPNHMTVCSASKAAALFAALGAMHPIATLCAQQMAAGHALSKFGRARIDALRMLVQRTGFTFEKSDACLSQKHLTVRYPLLGLSDNGISVTWGHQAQAWCDYVLLVDKVLTAMPPVAVDTNNYSTTDVGIDVNN
jgi:hypothetical protein